MGLIHEIVRNENLEKLTELIINGSNINEVDEMSRTPLHIAAWKGNSEIIQFLLRMKALTTIKAKDNFTPLHFAIQSGNLQCCILLINYDKTLLHSRISKGNKTGLHLATAKGNYEIVEFLLQSGADPTALTNKRQTALDFAKETPIFELIKSKIEQKIADDVKRVKKRSIAEVNPDENQITTTENERFSDYHPTNTSSSSSTTTTIPTTIPTNTSTIMISESELNSELSNELNISTSQINTTLTEIEKEKSETEAEEGEGEKKSEKIIKLDLTQKKKKKPKIGIHLSHLEDDEGC